LTGGRFIFASVLAEAVHLLQGGDGLLIDARSRMHYRRNHIHGAINLPWNDFDGAYLRNQLDLLQSDHWLIVYCSAANCTDSSTVATRLLEKGHRRVAIIAGGLNAWDGETRSALEDR